MTHLTWGHFEKDHAGSTNESDTMAKMVHHRNHSVARQGYCREKAGTVQKSTLDPAERGNANAECHDANACRDEAKIARCKLRRTRGLVPREERQGVSWCVARFGRMGTRR